MAPTPATDTTLTPAEDNSAASTKSPLPSTQNSSARSHNRQRRRARLFAAGDDAELYHRTERRSSSTAWASLGRSAALRGGRPQSEPSSAACCSRRARRPVRAAAAVIKQVGRVAGGGGARGRLRVASTLLLGADGGIHAFATSPGSGASGRPAGAATAHQQPQPGASSRARRRRCCRPSSTLTASPTSSSAAGGRPLRARADARRRVGRVGRARRRRGVVSAAAARGAQHLMELYVRGKDDGLYRVRQAPVPRCSAPSGSGGRRSAAPSRRAPPPRSTPTASPRSSPSAPTARCTTPPASPPARTPRRRGRDGGRGARRCAPSSSGRAGARSAPRCRRRPPPSSADGLIDVLVRGADRNLYCKPQVLGAAGTNLSWGAWAFVGGPVRASSVRNLYHALHLSDPGQTTPSSRWSCDLAALNRCRHSLKVVMARRSSAVRPGWKKST